MSVDMSKHFSTSALIRFTLPTIAMMIFTSCYTIVDGFFVSNYAGKTALAAVNLIVPAVMILASVGMMIGTGGSALVAKTLGEGDRPRARRHFSLLIILPSSWARCSPLAAGSSWNPRPPCSAPRREARCTMTPRFTAA